MMQQGRWLIGARAITVFVYGVTILYVGTMPRPVGPSMHFSESDKVLHAVVFGGLGLLAYRLSWAGWSSRAVRFHASVAIGWVAFWGAALEFAQSFVPSRSVELGDWVADVFGAVAVVAIAVLFRLERPLVP